MSKTPAKKAKAPAKKAAPAPAAKKKTAGATAKAPAKAPAKKAASKPVAGAKKPAKAPVKASAKTAKAPAKSLTKSPAKAPTKPAAKSQTKAPAKQAPAKQAPVKQAPVKQAPAKGAAKPVAKAPADKVGAKSAPGAKKSTPAKAPEAAKSKTPAKPSAATPSRAVAVRQAAPSAAAGMAPSAATGSVFTHTPQKAHQALIALSSTRPSQPIPMTPTAAVRKVDPKLVNAWKTKTGRDLTEDELLSMPDSEYMNDKQLDFFRARLEMLKEDLLSNAGETTEHLREETSIVPDPADRATIEEEHALELRTRDRERKLLKKISQALARIDAGDYGYCDETGEPIGLARLIARPTATLTLEAQQRRELKQKLFGD